MRLIRRIPLLTRYALFYLHPRTPRSQRDEKDYAAFLKGCRIALVGPAPSITGSGHGARIDSCDRVVRLNHSLPVPPELQTDAGIRTDILYHNLWRDHPRAPSFTELIPVLLDSVKWICAVNPYLNAEHPFADDIDAFTGILRDRLPFRTVAPRPWIRLQGTLLTRPGAGLSAIRDLLRFDIAELYLTGFTFYQTGTEYHAGYRGIGRSKVHQQGAQMKALKRWIRHDPRIVIDDTLRQILHAEPTPAKRRESDQ